VVELLDNIASPDIIFTVNLNTTKAFTVNYTIIRDTAYRTGTLTVAAGSVSGNIAYNDSFVENATTGITLTRDQIDSTIYVNYTSTSTGDPSDMAYVITSLF
jgi:hypothetical protein